MMGSTSIDYNGSSIKVYITRNTSYNEYIFNLMERLKFNSLSLNDFVKGYADKRGAHIDKRMSFLIHLINSHSEHTTTFIEYLAYLMIWAAKEQIVELNDYSIDL